MGTRADFYVGRGKDAEWLGSIAMDGYPCHSGHPMALLHIKDRAKYRRAVRKILREVTHATTPDQGWPWPWENSQTTDYAYAFDVGRDGVERVYVSCFGHKWQPGTRLREWGDGPKVEFPDMTSRMKVTMGERSGLIVISAPAP